jgi:tRNA nucleotidyltransferase (CCA-adding enzyme)
MEANWPLIIPPLLALIDDSSIQYKAKGCAYLSIFLQSCPSPLLGRTGLGEVFENAVTPCLMYLPSLTEEAESLHLLGAAYPALISLARVRFADEKQRDAKLEALDRILRYGILAGYAHAGDHVRIAELLVNQTAELINEMGSASVKHLKVCCKSSEVRTH